MFRSISFIFALATINVFLFNSAEAQTQCINANSMSNVDASQLEGTWFEVARKPNLANMSCIEVDLGLQADKKNIDIKVIYVDPDQKTWTNATMTASTPVDTPNNNGYKITFSLGDKSQSPVTLKLLGTDYKNYALVCGYSNANDQSTVFTAVLTRNRVPAETDLTSYEEIAKKSFSNFDDMSKIVQSEKCYKSAASAPFPVVATILGSIYALLKYVN